jgi:uncharacterized membrane protein YkvA (DUF1232 family)
MYRLIRLWRLAGQDLALLWYALRHPARPVWLPGVAVILGVYALDPVNFAVPLLGAIDDLVLLPLLLHAVTKLLPAEIRCGFAHRSLAR